MSHYLLPCPYSGSSKGPGLMFRVVIICWLLSPAARLRNCDGSVWSTDEMVTGRGKPMLLEGNLPNDTSTTDTTQTVL